jgi:hypothetical protein
MQSTELYDNDELEIDLGNSPGITVQNIDRTEPVSVFLDYRSGNTYQPILGEQKLVPGQLLVKTRISLGHEHIRVGVKGGRRGSQIAKVSW